MSADDAMQWAECLRSTLRENPAQAVHLSREAARNLADTLVALSLRRRELAESEAAAWSYAHSAAAEVRS